MYLLVFYCFLFFSGPHLKNASSIFRRYSRRGIRIGMPPLRHLFGNIVLDGEIWYSFVEFFFCFLFVTLLCSSLMLYGVGVAEDSSLMHNSWYNPLQIKSIGR